MLFTCFAILFSSDFTVDGLLYVPCYAPWRTRRSQHLPGYSGTVSTAGVSSEMLLMFSGPSILVCSACRFCIFCLGYIPPLLRLGSLVSLPNTPPRLHSVANFPNHVCPQDIASYRSSHDHIIMTFSVIVFEFGLSQLNVKVITPRSLLPSGSLTCTSFIIISSLEKTKYQICGVWFSRYLVGSLTCWVTNVSLVHFRNLYDEFCMFAPTTGSSFQFSSG